MTHLGSFMESSLTILEYKYKKTETLFSLHIMWKLSDDIQLKKITLHYFIHLEIIL